MKHLKLLFVFLIISISCKKQSELSKSFNCNSQQLSNLTTYSDFKEHFKIKIPSNWKTNLYYDQNQSEIFAADTTKQLSETYIIDVAYNYGNLSFDDVFFKRTDSILKKSNLKKLKANSFKFQEKPAYWYLSTGVKQGFKYHKFNLIVKVSKNAYSTSYSEIYGDKNIEERICESISIFENIEFLQ